MNLLITGLPGVGKTTLIRKLAVSLKAYHPAGFCTEEIREHGVRKGFQLASFDGHKGVLSHVDFNSRFRVGKYGVDVAGFERFLAGIDFLGPSSQFLIIDEIGKMECLSNQFISLVKRLLISDKILVATIALKGEGFIAEAKRRPDVTMFEITKSNRNRLAQEVLKSLNIPL